MTTAYITHTRSPEHDLPGHPEHAGRLAAIHALFESSGITDRLHNLMAEPAAEDQLRLVHAPEYLAALAALAGKERGLMFGSDTYALPPSYEVARLSAGAALLAVDTVLAGAADNALAAARPPGHHALPDLAMGFCLLANVALAVRHAQAVHQVERIMIVDYDVHHGNGTQAIFYPDPDVLYVSTHQSPFYPGTGAIGDTGVGEGLGATVNVPLPAGTDDAALAAVFEQVVWPVARRFQPELMLVSVGFDCHWDDPLGGMLVTLEGYRHMSAELIGMAQDLCAGRIVFVLEGGYNLDAVAHGMLNVAYALLGEDTISDPLGEPARVRRWTDRQPSLAPRLAQIREVHKLD